MPTPICGPMQQQAFRARTKAAGRALEGKVWRTRTEEWRNVLRPRLRAANLVLQAEELGAMDDRSLLDHVDRAYANVEAGHSCTSTSVEVDPSAGTVRLIS